MAEPIQTLVHKMELDENGVDDEETLKLARDVWAVSCSLYQGMPVIGAWLEQRIAWLVGSWLPGWQISYGQLFNPEEPKVRSRSWDLIVHRPINEIAGLPPAPAPGAGSPVVPKTLCCAVIDTKNNFSDVAGYARKPVFNLMNDAELSQLEFIGHSISKNIFACTSNNLPSTVEASGRNFGLNVFVMGRYVAGPVGPNRELRWELWSGGEDGTPLRRFREELQKTAAEWSRQQEQ